MATQVHSNIASRMGAWSARHRKIAVLGWLAFVLGIIGVGQIAGMRMLTTSDSLTGESARQHRIVASAGMPAAAYESVLIESRTHRFGDLAFTHAIESVANGVRSQPHVSNVISPLDNEPGLVSSDKHAALVRFQLAGEMNDTTTRVAGPLSAVAEAGTANPDFRIGEFGGASFGKATMDSAGQDFHRAEFLSIPVTVLILLLAFGALVAAILPVVLALTAFGAAFGLVLLTSHVFPIDMSAFSVMLLIGLAVGVDYSLFYIRREREERAAGRSPEEALLAAAATSGRSVLISGLTVIVAVGGLFLSGTSEFRGIAMGTILVVATSVLGSVTVLPALLSKLGDRIVKGRLPIRRRASETMGESRFWGGVITRVLRRPVVSVVAATAVLVVLAAPAFKLHTTQPGFDDYPSSMPILKTFDRMQHDFPAGPSTAEIAVRADDVNSTDFRLAVRRFKTTALATDEVYEPITVTKLSNHVAVLSVPLAGNGMNDKSTSAIQTLRKSVVPGTLANARGVNKVAVGGDTASAKDGNATLRSHTPLVFAFVLGLAFLLLMVTFRSIVIALKAIMLNLLSVGAAYGFIVAVFQWGWGESILGFHSTHSIASWIPLFLFVVLFGLSMDYHVFIISRIREAVDAGMSTENAVTHGIKTTAGVVTSAAFVMVVVFSIFGSLSQVSMKEIGTGLAFAVLLDATLVRAVLLPASMKLLGDWNWWLPRHLGWLPQVSLAETSAKEPVTA